MPLSPTATRALLAQLGHAPKRFLGQNFLVDGNIVRKSLELAAVRAGDAVVEIGPLDEGFPHEVLLDALQPLLLHLRPWLQAGDFLYRLADALRNLEANIRRHPAYQDNKLIPTVTPGDISLPQRFLDARRHLRQNFIAAQVTKLVVDRLVAIDVQHDHRQRCLVLIGLHQGSLRYFLETAYVYQVG